MCKTTSCFQPLGWLLLLLFGITSTHGLTSKIPAINNKIQVKPVQTHMDLIELGDLRYHEWMLDSATRPSQTAFRMATAELQQERMNQQAVAFLARDIDSNDVVGTAELSCIELEGCYNIESSPCRYYYVTDVVTAKAHRRKGVAAALMATLEQHTLQEANNDKDSTAVLLLHVEPNNEAALGFYKALGYEVVVSAEESLKGLNVDQLAINAEVQDQLLLYKTVIAETKASENTQEETKEVSKRKGPAKGFGR